MRSPHAIAIIGLGPKGLYCLERLLAHLAAHPPGLPVDVHVIHRDHQFGCSPIYDPGQPEHIRLNISVAEIDLWQTKNPSPTPASQPDFVSWYNAKFQPEVPLNGREYSARAWIGTYLMEGFRQLAAHLPEGVALHCQVGEAVDVRPSSGHYQIEVKPDQGQAFEVAAHKILLATGHSRPLPAEPAISYQAFASRHPGTSFIPFAYPVVETMAEILPGSGVAMKGIGLTFIDAVLELTEGRGGQFLRDGEGRLHYRASGLEPAAIYPFSRTGLPVVPKSEDLPEELRSLTFCSPAQLRALLEKARSEQRKVDFDRELWPLFELEMERAYYQVLMGPGAWREKLEGCGDDAEALLRVIADYRRENPEKPRLDYAAIIDPVRDLHFDSGAAFTRYIIDYLDDEIGMARRGQAGSPVKAAIEIWFEARYAMGVILEFGGLNPKSQQRLIEHHFSVLKRVVFGPPVVNLEKVLALLRAGRIDFSVAIDPEIRMDERLGCFELRGKRIPDAVVRVETLIDARYPSVSIDRDAAPLMQNLLQRGMARPFENRDGVQCYRPGAIDMTPQSQFIIGREGQVNEDIAVVGIPTENNLVGNLSLAPGSFPDAWARQVLVQLREEA